MDRDDPEQRIADLERQLAEQRRRPGLERQHAEAPERPAFSEASRRQGGYHRDEVEIAVQIGARVSALAGPNDVLVSSTLRDLVIGSGLEFDDRGAHELKGVPGEWRLFAVASP